MFTLDEEFLNEIGKSDMPQAEKAAFLDHLQAELEERVGTRISENLSDAQIDEFEKIIDGDPTTIQSVLDKAGDYQSNPTYQKMLAVGPEGGIADPSAEFASIKWLDDNCPDYRDVAAQVTADLKAEVATNRDVI